MIPSSYHLLEIFESIVESYTCYCFFAMIIHNCGGPARVVKFLSNSDRVLCCTFQKTHSKSVYRFVCFSMWGFVYIRPIISLVGFVFLFLKMDALFTVCQSIGTVITFHMLLCLLTLVYNVYEECHGLNVAYKLMVLKVSVGLVSIQAILMDYLFLYGFLAVPDDRSFTDFEQRDRVQRAYSVLCLAEFVILTYFLWVGHCPRIIPSQMFVPSELIAEAEFFPSLSGRLPQRPISLSKFLADVFFLWRRPCAPYVLLKKSGPYTALPNGENYGDMDKSLLFG